MKSMEYPKEALEAWVKRHNTPVENEIWLKARKRDNDYLRGACTIHGLWGIVIRLVVGILVFIAAVKFVGTSGKFDWSKMVRESPYWFWMVVAPLVIFIMRGVAGSAGKLAWRCYDRISIRKCEKCRVGYLNACYTDRIETEDDLSMDKLLRRLDLRDKADECAERKRCIRDIKTYWFAMTHEGLRREDLRYIHSLQFFDEIANEVPGFVASWEHYVGILRYIGTEHDSAAHTEDSTATPAS